MKVLCVQPVRNSISPDPSVIQVGCVYNVIKELVNYGRRFYELAENVGQAYWTGLFVPAENTPEEIAEYSITEKQTA